MEVAADSQSDLPELRSWVGEGGGEASGEPSGTDGGEGDRQQWTEEEWRQWNQWHWRWSGRNAYWSFSTSWGSPETPGGEVPNATSAAAGSDTRDPLWESDPWSRNNRTEEALKSSDKWWSSAKGDYADPPAWAGWGHYRLWRRALLRWNANTDVALHRRAEKVLKGLDWELQAMLEHFSETELSSNIYLDLIFSVLDVLAGEREDSEKRRSIRAALYEGCRKSDKSLAQYALRRESQFASAAKFLPLPDELKAFMLEEQSGLSRQGVQNLRVLTEGKHEYAKVKKALQVLDTEEEPLFKSGKNNYLTTPDEGEDCGSETEDEYMDEEVFVTIMEKEMDEDEALSFLSQQAPKRRTWSENRQLKAARRKDHRHFDEKTSQPEKPVNHRRLPISELKKITRCSNCGEKGHWREECDRPYRSKSSREKNEKTAMSAFVFLGSTGARPSGSFLNFGCLAEGDVLTFLTLPAGHTIVDPGASQDLCGQKSYEKLVQALAKNGLQPVKLDETPAPASGVGGDARPLFNALVPCVLGDKPGIIKLTVVREDIPQLLSVGLLEHAGAVIDIAQNKIDFRSFGSSTNMTRIGSGHRTISVAAWKGGSFPIPKQLELEFQLKPGAFDISDVAAGRVYTALSEGGTWITWLFMMMNG